MIKATKIYARFASEVYDDFGEVYYEQEYYRKEHADEELRKTKHVLWMARAMRAKIEAKRFFWFLSVDVSQGNREAEIWHESLYKKWRWAERKCLAKAKEFE